MLVGVSKPTTPTNEKKPRKTVHQQEDLFEFKLYIVGRTQKSLDTIQGLRSLMEERFQGLHSFEVIDLLTNPEAANSDDIITSPALLKVNPSPARKVIGNLLNSEKVMEVLGLPIKSKTGSIVEGNGTMFNYPKQRVFHSSIFKPFQSAIKS